MSNKSLTILAKNLEVSVGFLKGLSKGEKRKEGDFLRINAANACRAVASKTGYRSEQAARKGISKDVNLLFRSPKKIIQLLAKIISNARRNKNEKLEKLAQSAVSCLNS